MFYLKNGNWYMRLDDMDIMLIDNLKIIVSKSIANKIFKCQKEIFPITGFVINVMESKDKDKYILLFEEQIPDYKDIIKKFEENKNKIFDYIMSYDLN